MVSWLCESEMAGKTPLPQLSGTWPKQGNKEGILSGPPQRLNISSVKDFMHV